MYKVINKFETTKLYASSLFNGSQLFMWFEHAGTWHYDFNSPFALFGRHRKRENRSSFEARFD